MNFLRIFCSTVVNKFSTYSQYVSNCAFIYWFLFIYQLARLLSTSIIAAQLSLYIKSV